EAVATGQSLKSQIEAQWRESGAALDLVLRNSGNLDSDLPMTVSVDTNNCSAADAIGGYQLNASGNKYIFQLREAAKLAAGGERVIGWLRCSTLTTKGVIDVAF